MSFPSQDVPVFDPAAIDKLRKVAGDQDPGFVAEMAKLFAEETSKSMADLRTAVECKDWKVVGRVAHSLKSSAATLGFMRLSAVCKALELDTHGGGSSAATDDLVRGVLSEFESTAPILKTVR